MALSIFFAGAAKVSKSTDGASAQIFVPDADPFNAARFGAIADGLSHPLSAAAPGRSLAEWQSTYPHAGALTDEVDWCALQAAVNAAKAAGGGVVRGSGRFVVNKTVMFPECSQGISKTGGRPQSSVSFSGSGTEATQVWALSDFGGYIFDCENRFVTQWGSSGVWENFSIIGPGGNPGIGAVNCQTKGLGWAARRTVKNVLVQDCFYGMSMTGDQAHIDSFVANGCYYGIYFDVPNPGLFGDMLFSKTIISNCWKSSIGVHPNAAIPKGEWNTAILGASPFCIYKEFGQASSSQDTGLSSPVAFVARSVRFNSTQFENIGNAAISGGNGVSSTQGDSRPDTQNVRFNGCQWGQWSDTFKISAWGRVAMLDIHQCHQGFRMDGLNEPNLTVPGTSALFKIEYPGAFHISGDVSAILQNCRDAGKRVFQTNGRADAITIDHMGEWSGRMIQANGNPSVAIGSVIVHRDGNSQPSSGTDVEMVVGICMSPHVADYDYIAVADRGVVQVNSDAAGINNSIVRSAANGLASQSGPGEVLGWSYPGNGGSNNQNTVFLSLSR
jgi:hypothetical protein